MKNNVIMCGVTASVLLVGTLVCQAEKWDKSDFKAKGVESGFYDADSIRAQGNAVNWTEKYIFESGEVKNVTAALSKHQECKQNISKRGDVVQFQTDYQIEKPKYRSIARRYYNKGNELICTDKDTGEEFNTSWDKIRRGSPMEKALYDLVTKYKVNLK